MNQYLPILVTYVIYFIIIMSIGIFASRVTKNLSDYVLGGRTLNGPIAALGAGASDMSGWLLLGLPGGVYLLGLSKIWMPIGLAVGAYINWIFIAKRLRIYTEIANNSLTIPSYFDNRFDDKSGLLRTVTAIVVLLFFTFYASSGFVSCALLFQTTFNLDYKTALMISATFLVLYTSIGGFLAVNWVDFLQGCLMLFALLIVPAMTVHAIGGMEPTLNTLQQLHFDYHDIFGSLTTVGIISLLAWGVGYFGQPHILVRFMAAKSVSVLPLARRICMTWMVLSLAGAIATGFFGIAYFAQHPLTNPETVFIVLSEKLFPNYLVGILLAAVLSAIMSTIAAQLLASSSALTEDLYHRFVRHYKGSAKELLWVSRLTVLLVALVAIYLATNPKSSILQMVSYAWAGLGASFGPVIVFSLYWKRMTHNGAVAGIIMGAIGVILWKYLEKQNFTETLNAVFDIYEILPGFILSSIGIVVVSLLDKKPSAAIQQQFDTMLTQVKNS